jgi:hypothetical protein
VGTPSSSVNHYLGQEAKRRGIEVAQLSPFVAEFQGPMWQLPEFERSYPFLLCAFDPLQEPDPRAAYMTCVAHAPAWIDRVQSETPQYLMVQEDLYLERCVR